MWLFWIVWACVCACARTHTHKHGCLRLHTVCARVHVFGFVSVPQYQILLSQLSASLSLVVICLSTSQPSASPSVSLSSLYWVFHLNPSVLHPSFDLTLSVLPHRFPIFFLLWASYCLFTPMPFPSLPLSFCILLYFFWNTFNLSLHSGWFSPLNHSFSKPTLDFIFLFIIFFICCETQHNRISSRKSFPICLGSPYFSLKWTHEGRDSG